MINQCDPKAGNLAVRQEIDQAIANVLDSGWYILGEECQKFEEEFAQYNQTQFAVGVANGTDALEISLRAVGIEPGDKVATVSHTAVATVSAIRRLGAIPIFVDIADDYTMDPKQLGKLLGSQNQGEIKAIVVVHLYGQPASINNILNLSDKFTIPVIEDCAQAHGALLNGQKVGSFGVAGCFSFYPTKNLGAVGDGGMVVCKDKEIYEKCLLIRQYGWKDRYISCLEGVNSRLDELQAAVLRVKLKYLDQSNQRRREIAQFYLNNLSSDDLILPAMISGTKHVFHQFVVQNENRDRLKTELEKLGVATAIHYPKAVHQQAAYARKEYLPMPLNKTEAVCDQLLSLPMFPEIVDDEVSTVCEAVNTVLKSFKQV